MLAISNFNYNGNSYTFTWNGRELAKAVKGVVTTTYKYGADGLRTQKTVGSTVYNYYYADGLLIRQTWGTNYMDFLYDETGSAYSFIYNGTQYYYVHNLQGDVVKILNASGSVIATYTYDAWGKVTNSGNIIGLYNPIRYRGYYYDTDTGFYYLQSRYYDPAIKRFISADDASLIGANGDFISLNLYTYCLNNPIDRFDSNGNFSWKTMFAIGTTVAIVGLALLAAIPTGGGSLVLAGVGITATAATTAANALAVTGLAITSASLATGIVEESPFIFSSNNNHGKEKGKEFRGGSKKQRDKWFGYENNLPFKKWFERVGKRKHNHGNDIDTKQIADQLYEYWKSLGCPFPK